MSKAAVKPTKEQAAKESEATAKRREQALDAALKQIEKNFGTGSIMRLAADQVVHVAGIPTGALSLDLALGGQGMPRGRICELFGPEGSGKTTLLEDLRQALERKGRRTKLLFVNDVSPLPEAQCRRFLSELTPQDLVLLDGADAIHRSSWMLFRRHTITHAAGLIVTSHRPGPLPTLIECSTTPPLLKEIVAALAPQSSAISPALLDDLHARHCGNLRACLRDLYEFYARI